MAEGVRFTIWMSLKERRLLKEMAEQYGTSQNYIIRVAVRQMLGIEESVPQMAWQRVTSPGPPRVIPFHDTPGNGSKDATSS